MKSLLLCLCFLFSGHYTLAQLNDVPPPPPVYKEIIKPYEIFNVGGLKGLKVDGEVKIKPTYKSIESLRQKDYVRAKSEKGWFLFSMNGEMLSPKAYTAIEDVFKHTSYFSNSKKVPSRYTNIPKTKPLFQVSLGKLKGVIDEKGEILIPIEYDKLRQFTAKKNQKWGAIDLDNNILIPFEYEEIGAFNMAHRTVAKQGGKKGVIDIKGNGIIPMKYDELEFLGIDFLKVKENGKWKLLDLEGNQFLPGAYDQLIQMRTGDFQVENNGLIGIFNKEGKEILKLEFKQVLPYQYKYFIAQKGNYVGVYHPVNGWLIPLSYSEIHSAGMENIPLLIATQNGKKGIIDLENNTLLAFEYDHLDKLENGFARAQKNGKWGFVELNQDLKSFKVAVDFLYDKVEPFTRGRMEFEKKGQKGYLIYAFRKRMIEESKFLKQK